MIILKPKTMNTDFKTYISVTQLPHNLIALSVEHYVTFNSDLVDNVWNNGFWYVAVLLNKQWKTR